jgi:hypothetical protein
VNTIDKLLKQLRRAYVKLPATADRPVARRNARARVLAQLRKMRALIDEEFPAIIKRGKVKRLKTPEGRQERIERAGWVFESSADAVVHYAAAGVPVRRVAGCAYIPEWARAIGPLHPSALRAAKKNRQLQRARVAAATLLRDEITTALIEPKTARWKPLAHNVKS